MKSPILDTINEKLKDFGKINEIKNDIDKNIKAIVLSMLKKLNLVTREEFDLQQQLLVKTREKLEQIEQKLK
jgi:BMFP domain-containing protein YqiC